MKKLATLVITLLVVVLVIVIIANISGRSELNERETILIAANLPLSGPLATYGVAVREGAMMAVDELQKTHPDKLPKLSIDWQDNNAL